MKGDIFVFFNFALFVIFFENTALRGHGYPHPSLSRKRARVRKDLVLFASKNPSPIPMGEG
jgi:hypothetical protein